MTRLELWDAIVECGIATEEEIELVTAINGFHDDALNDIIFVRTGYRNIESFLEDWKSVLNYKKTIGGFTNELPEQLYKR